jgi:hypothetical protein
VNRKSIVVKERHDGRVVEIALGPPRGNIVTMDLMEELGMRPKASTRFSTSARPIGSTAAERYRDP